MSSERRDLLLTKALADIEAAKAALALEQHDLQSEREWLERRIDEEKARLERG